ncbi:MAG: exopolysaccharide biosynthesis protein [Homoserinimonas sp.]|jgi:O-antigen ligase|nr:exopolysaccharide biosynthesis protein [Mycetocola sp.]MCU1546935.1 exopolysaccharide biosynthesis protein [Homoserinimonas sp.]
MPRHVTLPPSLQHFFGSARLAAALATASVCLGIFAWSLHNTIGWAGLIAMIAALAAFCALSLFARRDSIDWAGLVPVSLLIFFGWATLSIFWSQYQWATLAGVAYLFAFTVLGIYVALVRDTIQIIRIFGDVLRFTFALSLALEILSGLLIDSPIPFLAIGGHLDQLGPISGVLGNRNELGLLAVIGGISFAIEWRTRSVRRGLAIGSLALAGITLALTGSPIAWVTAFIAAAAMTLLYGLRRLTPEKKRFWQFGMLALAAATAVLAWLFRGPLVAALNVGGELNYRLRLWQDMWALVPRNFMEGWGWMGHWNSDVPPYQFFGLGSGRPNTSAVNAYLDVWFQVGLIGLVAFLLLVGLAFVRSWLLAARKRSVIFTWPAIVLAALLTSSVAESGILAEFGWLTFIICCVKASQNLSWRVAFQRPLEPDPL